MMIVGNCPHCGAPIWAQDSGWLSILPPPSMFSCNCRFAAAPQPVVQRPITPVWPNGIGTGTPYDPWKTTVWC